MEYPKTENWPQHVWINDQCIEIHAPATAIWPWLAQMGNGRAGWYSYDWLDNLGRKSLEVIDPQLTAIEKGQKIPLAMISDFVENEFITFQFGSQITFTYFLESLGPKTRLWTRLRIPHASWLLKSTLSFGHQIMQDKQFREIKRRAENNC
jgi:hypothetical protein